MAPSVAASIARASRHARAASRTSSPRASCAQAVPHAASACAAAARIRKARTARLETAIVKARADPSRASARNRSSTEVRRQNTEGEVERAAQPIRDGHGDPHDAEAPSSQQRASPCRSRRRRRAARRTEAAAPASRRPARSAPSGAAAPRATPAARKSTPQPSALARTAGAPAPPRSRRTGVPRRRPATRRTSTAPARAPRGSRSGKRPSEVENRHDRADAAATSARASETAPRRRRGPTPRSRTPSRST